MDGNTYLCDWKKTRNGFSLWLVDRPDISVSEISIDECQDALGDLIWEEFGDAEAIIEFVGAPPGLPKRYASPEFRAVTWDSAATLKIPIEELYTGGLCPVCGACVGRRTDKEIRVVKLPEDAIGVSVGRISAAVYSEKFLREVSGIDSDRFELRPVSPLPRFKGNEVYFEVIPTAKSSRVLPVAVKKLEKNLQAWKCVHCGEYDISYLIETSFVHFVSSAAVAGLANPVFLLGKTLCMRGASWRDVKRRLSTKVISTEQLGIVPESDIDHEPQFQIRSPPSRPVPFWMRTVGKKGSE